MLPGDLRVLILLSGSGVSTMSRTDSPRTALADQKLLSVRPVRCSPCRVGDLIAEQREAQSVVA